MRENFRERFSLDYLLPTPEEKQRKELSDLFDRLARAAYKAADPNLKMELAVIASLGQEKLKPSPARRR